MSKYLELALRATYFQSPDLQPHALLPNAAAVPLFSEDYFTWFLEQADSQQIPNPTSAQFSYLLRQIDAQAWSRKDIRPASLRTADCGEGRYLINLQTIEQDAIEISASGWRAAESSAEHFLRPTLSKPYPKPDFSRESLSTHLGKMFGLDGHGSGALSRWLAQAMLPGVPPPVLVITGEARQQAAAKLRNLIDPVAHAIHPLPHSGRGFGQLALTNKILAFDAGARLSKAKREAINNLNRGVEVRLKEASKRRDPLSTTLSRAIIIAAEEKIDVHPNQLSMEINQAGTAPAGEVFGALLTMLVCFLRQFRTANPYAVTAPRPVLLLPSPSNTYEFGDVPSP